MIERKRVGSAERIAASVVLCFLALIHPVLLHASVEDAGTYGASFLRIPVGAAAISSPDVVAAMDPDATLIFSNLASLGDLRTAQLCVSRSNWLDDLSMNAASLGAPIPRLGLVWSLGSRFLYSGGIQGFDDSENLVDSQSYYGVALSTAVSRRFTRTGIALGAGITYLRESLPMETGDGIAFSFGASYARAGHRVDVYAENVGGSLDYTGREYPIESEYVAGYGYSILRAPARLDVGTQIVASGSGITRVEFGGAYRFHRMMTIRAGYNYAFDAPPQSPFPLSAGLGFRYRNLSLDYAYTSQEYFSSTHTFSVGISFGSGSNPLDTRSRRDGGAVTPEPLSSGQPAAPSAATPTAAPEKIAPRPADGPKFLITGGTHARRESAESEVRALKLLKIDATVEAVGNQYRVVIEKLDSRAKAETALAKYESRGHRFRLLTQAP
jgi:hypothetical protein